MESWSWSWQGVITSIVAALLLGGIPTLLTWIKKKWPQHGELVRYWLTTAAALAILLYATTGYILFAKHEVKTTPDNVEENVKLWAEHLGMNIGPANEPDSYFAHTLSLPSNVQPV
jgi:Flp pilus assembly pilin Flp